MNDLNATENPAKGFVQISDDEILRIFSYLWFHDLFRASAASYRLRKLVIGNKSLIFTLLVNQLSHCGVKNVNFEGLVTTLSAECHEILHLCSRMSYWPTDADKNLLKFNLEEVNVNGQTSLCIAYTGRVLGNNRSFVANHHFPVLKSHMREAAAQAKTGNGTGNKGRKVDQKEFEYPDSAIMSGKLEIPTISSYPFTKVVYDPVQECTVPVLSSIAYYEVTIHPVGMSSSRQNRSNWIDARRVQNGDMTTAGTGTSSSSSTSSNTRITTVDNTPLSSFNPCVAIGIANPLHNMRHMPGWNANSFGFHGDDGMFFHRSMNQGTQFTSEPHDAMFGVGDTVGFGIIYPHCPPEQLNNWGMKYNSVTQLFLTKNGNYVGKVNEFDANFDKYPWFPCVGTDSHSALEMNFGNKGVPFQFDIQLFESEVLQWMQRQAERIGATMGPAGKKQSQSTTSVAAEEPVRKVSKPTGRTKPQQGSSVEIPVNIFHPPSSQTMAVDSDLRSCDSTVSATGATSATSDATVANAATSAANGGEYNSKLSAEELAFKTVSHEGRNVSYYTNKTSDSATSSSSSSSSSSQPADHNLMQFFPDIPKPSPLPFLSPYRRISAAATSVGRGSAISTSTTTRASSSSSSSLPSSTSFSSSSSTQRPQTSVASTPAKAMGGISIRSPAATTNPTPSSLGDSSGRNQRRKLPQLHSSFNSTQLRALVQFNSSYIRHRFRRSLRPEEVESQISALEAEEQDAAGAVAFRQVNGSGSGSGSGNDSGSGTGAAEDVFSAIASIVSMHEHDHGHEHGEEEEEEEEEDDGSSDSVWEDIDEEDDEEEEEGVQEV